MEICPTYNEQSYKLYQLVCSTPIINNQQRSAINHLLPFGKSSVDYNDFKTTCVMAPTVQCNKITNTCGLSAPTSETPIVKINNIPKIKQETYYF